MAFGAALRQFSAKPVQGLLQRPVGRCLQPATLCQRPLIAHAMAFASKVERRPVDPLIQRPLIAHAMAFATKVERRPVGPNKPTKPLSPFIRFAAAFRERMKDSDMSGKELFAKCGEEWCQLPAEGRQVYEDAYEDDMALYSKLLDEYVASGQEDAWKRDPELPRKPMSSYMQFLTEFRKQLSEEMKVTQANQKAGEQWEAMTEAQKRPYEQRYEDEMKTYDSAMALYKASGKQEAWEKRVGIYDQKMRKKEAQEELKEKKAAEKAKLKAKKEADPKKAKEKREKEKLKAKKEADAKKAKEKEEKEKLKAKKKADAKKAKEEKKKEKEHAKKAGATPSSS